jgi:hypothetical protein
MFSLGFLVARYKYGWKNSSFDHNQPLNQANGYYSRDGKVFYTYQPGLHEMEGTRDVSELPNEIVAKGGIRVGRREMP